MTKDPTMPFPDEAAILLGKLAKVLNPTDDPAGVHLVAIFVWQRIGSEVVTRFGFAPIVKNEEATLQMIKLSAEKHLADFAKESN